MQANNPTLLVEEKSKEDEKLRASGIWLNLIGRLALMTLLFSLEKLSSKCQYFYFIECKMVFLSEFIQFYTINFKNPYKDLFIL